MTSRSLLLNRLTRKVVRHLRTFKVSLPLLFYVAKNIP